ncbi:3-isopropylmalate dehydratase small subunit 3-like [Phalaenopsis equestris]|uniref:3-isopropylmalate dehydratase small subunit 3-like n=1 Tax=Phalaenopsis equestris TaxID=78828 RepID=UPI0009E205F6|nr:3-isopropylmalate dehydratase small subunit 3-like [Phalaenopsis equestris]
MATTTPSKSVHFSHLVKTPVFPCRHWISNLQIPTLPSPLKTLTLTPRRSLIAPLFAAADNNPTSSSPIKTFHGLCYVVGDNIDTDQIIPAEHLTLVPSKPDEYRKLGSLAFVGLPTASYPVPFVNPGDNSTRFSVVIGGDNFGCGSSREHAPVAIGASGARVVVAESYARIFFRNCVATGEVYPLETEEVGIWKECSTGDTVTVDLAGNRLINHTKGKEYKLKPIGDAGPVIEAGGIFAYARKTGMIASTAA